MRFLTMIGVVVALGAPLAQAETLCVDPDNASCFATIQEAEDNAADGDTINIRPGVYLENVVVDVPNLEIRGSRKTILDPDDPNSGFGLQLLAPGFMVRGFMIRNGATDAIRIEAAATGGTIRDMMIGGPRSDCIHVLAADTWVLKNEFLGCGSDFVEFIADDVVIRDNEGKFGDNECFQGTGNRAIIDGNRAQNCEDSDGYEFSGDDIEVTDNWVLATDGSFISITGDNALVHRNRGMGTEDIDINGANPTVTDNRLAALADPAIDLRCTGCTPGGTVSGNRAEHVGDGGDAFRFRGDLSGLTVERNRVSYAEGNGFYLADTTSNFTLTRNQATNIGNQSSDSCFVIQGSGHTLEDNRAGDCHAAGFSFDGNGHSSEGDRSSWTIGGGFVFGSIDTTTGVTVRDSQVKDTNGAAYDVRSNAANTTIESPRVRGDIGQDACDEGAGTTFNDEDDDFVISLTCRIVF